MSKNPPNFHLRILGKLSNGLRVKTNVTFQRHELLKRKQSKKESWEQLKEVLADMAEKRDIFGGEDK